jgi:hypothetical protein
MDDLYRRLGNLDNKIIGAYGIVSGIAGATSRFTNSDQKFNNSNTYQKIKEIKVYRSIKSFRLRWQMWVSGPATEGYAKVYVNGVAVGVEKTTTSNPGPGDWHEDDITLDEPLKWGETIELWGSSNSASGTVLVEEIDLRFDEFVINDP